MRSYTVVIIYILVNQLADLSRSLVFVGIKLFCLETAKLSFNHDVVGPAAPAIHALTDIQAAKPLFIVGTGKLTTLIEIEDGWNDTLFDRFFYGMNDIFCFQTVGKVMADQPSAIPVNDCSQIHRGMQHWNVGDGNRPYLIGE